MDKRITVAKAGENSRRATLAETMWYYANGWSPMKADDTELLAVFLATGQLGETDGWNTVDNKKLHCLITTDHRLAGHLTTTDPQGECLGCVQIVRQPSIPQPKEQPKDDIEQTLEERGKTHGDFSEQSELMDQLEKVLDKRLKRLSPPHRFAVRMMLVKLVRILTGGAQCRDSWHDICGYGKLGEKHCG